MNTPKVITLTTIPQLRDSLVPWVSSAREIFSAPEYTGKKVGCAPLSLQDTKKTLTGFSTFAPSYDIVEISDGKKILAIRMNDAAVVNTKLPFFRKRFLARMQRVVNTCLEVRMYQALG